MGTWGHGPWDNDTSMDWVYELEEANDVSFLEKNLTRVLESNEYLDAPACDQAIAASEVVAVMCGAAGKQTPPVVTTWATNRKASLRMIADALEVVQKLSVEGESYELWEESGDLDKWLASMEDLGSRLRSCLQ